jgi:hypothetical protein
MLKNLNTPLSIFLVIALCSFLPFEYYLEHNSETIRDITVCEINFLDHGPFGPSTQAEV